MDYDEFRNNLLQVSSEIKKERPDIHNKYNESEIKANVGQEFIMALGYNFKNPKIIGREVKCDDWNIKDKNKIPIVDWEVRNPNPIFLMEFQTENYIDHLYRLKTYFQEKVIVKFGILIDKTNFYFFSDFNDMNLMDRKPFYFFSICYLQDKDIEFLWNFHKDNFNECTYNKIKTDYSKIKDENEDDISQSLFQSIINSYNKSHNQLIFEYCKRDEWTSPDDIEEYFNKIEVSYTDSSIQKRMSELFYERILERIEVLYEKRKVFVYKTRKEYLKYNNVRMCRNQFKNKIKKVIFSHIEKLAPPHSFGISVLSLREKLDISWEICKELCEEIPEIEEISKNIYRMKPILFMSDEGF